MKVLIVDDHPLMRVGVRELLQRNFEAIEVEEASCLAEAVSAFTARPADLVILDLVLPDTSGTEGAARMLALAPGVPILILSLNAESAYATRLLQMGVAGYLPKDRAGEELAVAVRRLMQGGRYVTAAMAQQLVGLLDGKPGTALPHEQLSAQEHRVMLQIAAGRTPAEIAETMHLSVKTVASYRARILAKGGWKNNIELAKYCLQYGLTAPD